MSAPNRATLWGTAIVEELVAAGVDAVCVSPGSRSTPLTVAFAAEPEIETFSPLDERSGAYFALGRARRTGRPVAVVTTSGTAAANLHPAVVEANQAGVPLLVLTADRPSELQDSGANQTVDQTGLFGDAVRWFRELPEPAPEARRLRSLRVACDRAVAEATGADPGPVHLNVPLGKPLEPTPVEASDPNHVPEEFAAEAPLAAEGRVGPFVETTAGEPTLSPTERAQLAGSLDNADRVLVVCGPTAQPSPTREALAAFLERVQAPVLADPLSGHRFGPHVSGHTICGGYDSYLHGATAWPEPDIVFRFGASPTSKVLRAYLRDVDARQVVVDPAGGWPEAAFTATDLVVADPTRLLSSLAEAVTRPSDPDWQIRFAAAEAHYWPLVTERADRDVCEGDVLGTVAGLAPDPSTLFVSNSMPVRDLDRFARPRTATITALGNRGASGIDGITSTALGAGSAVGEPLILVTGDLAYYHDMNGLLALGHFDVDATVVLVNNDGGGIFHKLPIEEFDPPFTEQFKTPHGLDFSPTEALYDLTFERVEDFEAFEERFASVVGDGEATVLEVTFDAETSHRIREQLHERVCRQIP